MADPVLNAVEYDPFAEPALARAVPTTESQRELWLADQLGREASLSFNESVSLSIEGSLDVAALQRALLELSNRHEALRSTLSGDGLELLIAPQGALQADVLDFSALDPIAKEDAVRAVCVQAVETQFDLAKGPLVRAQIVKLGATTHELVITSHHIVCDGWSYGVLSREVMTLYAAETGGAPVTTPAASFGDFALAQLDDAHVSAADADLRYWVSQYDSSVPVLDLPLDRVRPAQRTFNSRRLDVPVDAALVDAVRKLGAKHGASLFATLFSLFSGLMSRLGSADEVVVGVPAAAQAAEGQESLVGHGVNLLPVRVGVDVNTDFSSFLKKIRSQVLDAYDHQTCTFGSLLKRLKLERDPSRLPLVAVQFNLDAAIPSQALSVGGLQVSLRSNPRTFENFEIFLNASQVDGALVLECQYNSDLFDEATIQRWMESYRSAMQRAVQSPQQPVAALFEQTADEAAKIASFNRTEMAYATSARVESLVAAQARAKPNDVAVVSGNKSVTYRELDERANALAAKLREKGVGAGSLVGLFCGRNDSMIVGLLGILKSGAGYVPLDPSFPADRLAFMAEDAQLRFIASDESVRDKWSFNASERVDIECGQRADAPAPQGTPADVAYVLYTSGSTGKPKGVQVEHRNVVNFLESMRHEPGCTASDVLLAVTTLSFDIAGLEVWLPLSVGARVVIATRDDAVDGQRLIELITRHGVSILQATPATWRLLLEAGWQGSSKLKALVGGEALPRDLADTLAGSKVGELWNMYGPTETTIWSTLQRVRAASGPISIGHPIGNTQVHIVDTALRPVPLGAVGEIVIGGDGVTRGYLGRPELTNEKFVADPMRAGARWYRTGDLGRWKPDGTLECLGRLDHQIKLRGYRIELGEIESALASYQGVERAVVMVREDQPGDVRLVAYLVAQPGVAKADALREHLRRGLPEYMIPQSFVEMPAIPLLPNGKINRKALPKPEADASGTRSAQRVAPRTPLEQSVVAAMEKVLNLPGLGIRDNFFSLGGHSLLAARLTASLNKELSLSLPLRTVFESPTAETLAVAIEKASASPAARRAPIVHQANQGTAPLTVMQERIRFMEDLHPGRVVYNTPSAHRLTGAMDVAAFGRAFNLIISRQPGLRTVIEKTANGPMQRVHEKLDLTIPYTDLSTLPEAQREAELMRQMQAIVDTPMDIHVLPLFRVHLYRMSADSHVFLFMPHHIIWDGWSFDLLYQEMSAAYPAMLGKAREALPPLKVTYVDYANWHRDWMSSDDFKGQLQFWKGRYAGIESPRALPTDRPRNAGMTGTGAVEWVHIDKTLTEQLRDLARGADATLNMLTMAVYAAMMSEAVSSRSLVLGVPVRGRLISEVESVMGFFNNLLPAHLNVDTSIGLKDWIATVKRELLALFANQDVPFERLASEPEIAVHAQKSGLYQSLFSFQDARERERSWGELKHQSVLIMQKGATEDFGLWLMEVPGGLEGGVNFNADIFERSTAQLFRARFIGLLQAAVRNPSATVAQLLAMPSDVQSQFSNWARTGAQSAASAKAAAPAPQARVAGGNTQRSETEAKLARIWAGLLGIEDASISSQDNFFDLGGNSLLVMQAVAEMEKQLGRKVDPRSYVYESLGQLASASGAAAAGGAEAKQAAGGGEADAESVRALAAIWGNLLGMDPSQIQGTDNFFDLGGNSLLVMRAVAEGEQKLGWQFEPRRYVYESLQQLAVRVATAAPVAAAQPVEQPKPAKSGVFGRLFGKSGRG